MLARHWSATLLLILGLGIPAQGVAGHSCPSSLSTGFGWGPRLQLVGVARHYALLTGPNIPGTWYDWIYIGTYQGRWKDRIVQIEIRCDTNQILGLF